MFPPHPLTLDDLEGGLVVSLESFTFTVDPLNPPIHHHNINKQQKKNRKPCEEGMSLGLVRGLRGEVWFIIGLNPPTLCNYSDRKRDETKKR